MKYHYLLLLSLCMMLAIVIDGVNIPKFSVMKKDGNNDKKALGKNIVPSVKNMLFDLLLFKRAKKNIKAEDSLDESTSKKEALDTKIKKNEKKNVSKDTKKAKKERKQKPVEDLTTTEKAKLLNREKVMANILQLGTSFGAIFLTQSFFALPKLNSSPELLRYARMFFAGYLLFSHVYYYSMKYLIRRRHNTATLPSSIASNPIEKFLSQLQSSPLAMPMKLILGDGAMELLQSVLPIGSKEGKEVITIEEYDLKENAKLFHALLWDIGAVLYMHVYLRLHRMLVLIPVMGLTKRLQSPLTLIYAFGLRDDLPGSTLIRPFQSALSHFLQKTLKSGLGAKVVMEEEPAVSLSPAATTETTEAVAEAVEEDVKYPQEDMSTTPEEAVYEEEILQKEEVAAEFTEKESMSVSVPTSSNTVSTVSAVSTESTESSTVTRQSQPTAATKTIHTKTLTLNTVHGHTEGPPSRPSSTETAAVAGRKQLSKKEKLAQLQKEFDKVVQELERDLEDPKAVSATASTTTSATAYVRQSHSPSAFTGTGHTQSIQTQEEQGEDEVEIEEEEEVVDEEGVVTQADEETLPNHSSNSNSNSYHSK